MKAGDLGAYARKSPGKLPVMVFYKVGNGGVGAVRALSAQVMRIDDGSEKGLECFGIEIANVTAAHLEEENK